MKTIKLIHVVGPYQQRKTDLRLLHLKLGGGILLFNYRFLLHDQENEDKYPKILSWIQSQIMDHRIVVTGGLRPQKAASLIRQAYPDTQLVQYMYVHREGVNHEKPRST